MVDTQHFCLRWNNYQSSITSAFENLRDDEDFVDVTLACDGKSLKAHRVVLSACSPYFRELLKSTPCKHPVIVLQDVAFSDLHALVEFIYHGEVNVHQRSLSSFLKTAEVLRVSGLTQQTDQPDRDELSHVRALAAGGNHLPFHEKSEETFPRGGSPTPVTPTPTTVQQLLRRAQIRRNERRTPDPHDESAKRPRVPSPPLNNNDATPTDFSMVKNNHLSTKVEGNGVHDENSLVEDNIKCEPLELTGGNGGGNAGNNEDSSDSGAAASDRPPASASSNEHEPEPEHTSAQNFLPESKLFTSTPGSFNFSMAALTTDHTPLSVKFPGLGHGLQTPDLAGTSQDQEVAEEDGGWQSTTNIEYQRKIQESNQNTSANRYGETVMQPQHQELPIIDLLDNINDPMEIVLKSEPISPRMDELESCLLSSHTIERHTDLDSAHEYRHDGLRDKQQPQTSGRSSNNDVSPFDLRWLRSRNGLVQSKHVDASSRSYHEPDHKSSNRTYCNFCQKTFSRAWSLQRHLADTHFYVPQSLSCDQCGRSYKSRNSLVSHKSQYHARKDRKEHEAQCEVTY
ncbi:broad-complex core protein isoforms 1/2/3/4/5 isoform X1 [Temnothorax curvispinosus]|uniref:Broad-complex core protein isoforms 1/2/3/4/5 isoform X1 n=1 Tax=Temnothorax curvispinosus TaxID=300111 RepID=A0A6J1PBW2_9HYME|nr:broad-complex core protein isoforms 1/2/3/4/5 isoform X1 [Temnothorax curvispinosus]XP_024867007.1 broad-complex core protein isoforms 1/2/3/4/5 isoform X1 [Temnothorax curvispinosus]XP_024867008.1 broad-complex core protein isoforms 1/2/3/4/5 isoform X1 [Temnothorax curvispinosus]XP_024867009.1 broad-complex core protein isoforms 1/2/3/4/5 isoform X1 [Temnothorax curvispinosus]XP_024867011.1 broad-complex core protein isoforms 1/2/3/4/5 isoform X1 [Temnothorax curvispinosus]XP_024867012.1 